MATNLAFCVRMVSVKTRHVLYVENWATRKACIIIFCGMKFLLLLFTSVRDFSDTVPKGILMHPIITFSLESNYYVVMDKFFFFIKQLTEFWGTMVVGNTKYLPSAKCFELGQPARTAHAHTFSQRNHRVCLFYLGFYAVSKVFQLFKSDSSQIHVSWTIYFLTSA